MRGGSVPSRCRARGLDERMQQPWQPCEPLALEPLDLNALSSSTRDFLLSYTIEFVSIGFLHAGDFRLSRDCTSQEARYFQSSDGAVLGWACVAAGGERSFGYVSVLEDGTLVRSTPEESCAPWSCCRFPVHVNFGSGCGLEELLVSHLKSLTDLEHGCGPTVRYAADKVPEVLRYQHVLMHATEYGQGAPATSIPDAPVGGTRVMAAR